MGGNRMGGLIVHEWLASSGGSEKVVEEMALAMPDSEIRCLWAESTTNHLAAPVQESWLAKTPLRGRKALAMPFMSPTWTRMRADKKYDWMLVSSHLFAHHARLRNQPQIPKFSYIHTPARYIWTPEMDPRGNGRLARAVAPYLRRQDLAASPFSGELAANSNFIRDRIRECWNRDASVLYPPVQVRAIAGMGDWSEQLTPAESRIFHSLPSTFVLGASRLVAYKRLDQVIEFGAASSVPVVIAGSGPESARLKELADRTETSVTFVGKVSDAMLYALYQRATALIFPAIEDFGIMPVEAMAVGTPVIGPITGGVAETVVDGVSGQRVSDFKDHREMESALRHVESLSTQACSEYAMKFDARVFREGLGTWMGLDTVDDAKGAEAFDNQI
jgi:glycosyltransferase involved in cell wall biosynthesis